MNQWVNESIPLLVSELNYPLHDAIKASIKTRKVQHDCITGFQRVNHALELGERGYRHAIDARDHFTGDNFIGTNVGGEAVRIDFLHIKAFDAGQSLVGDQLWR